MLKSLLYCIKNNKILSIVVLIGFVLHMSIIMPSGSHYCFENGCGLAFWGVHSFDAMWHLEIAQATFTGISPRVATYAGASLSGYNILMDWIMYVVSLAGIPPLFTLFKLIPPIWFFSYTITLLLFAKWYRPQLRYFSATLLGCMYFSGHLGYLLQLYHSGSIMKGAQSFSLQPLTALLNTQFALSLPFLMMMWTIIARRKYSWQTTFFVAFCVSAAMGLKFYGGVVGLFICAVYLFDWLLLKRSMKIVLTHGCVIGISMAFVAYLVYDPFTAQKTGSIFTFSPFAIVHSVIEEADMIHLPQMVDARYFLYASGKWGPRLLFIELLSTLLYLILNFGTRVLGIAFVIGQALNRRVERIDFYLLLTTLFSFSLSVLFIQKGDWWNTVQFSYYGIVFSTILLADLLYRLFVSGIKWKILTGICIVVFSLPSNISVFRTFLFTTPPFIPQVELSALAHLKKLPDGVVLNTFDLKKDAKYPFLSYENTGYIAAFTGKQLYLGHVGPLTIIGVDYKPRLERIRKKDCSVFQAVDYIYITKWQDKAFMKKCVKEIGKFKSIYNKQEVSIWQRLK